MGCGEKRHCLVVVEVVRGRDDSLLILADPIFVALLGAVGASICLVVAFLTTADDSLLVLVHPIFGVLLGAVFASLHLFIDLVTAADAAVEMT